MAPKNEYQRRNAERRREAQNAKALKRFGGRTFRHPDSITQLTFWIAAFTFFLFAVGIIQAVAFVQSERAFISVQRTGFSDEPLIADAPTVSMFVDLWNSGKSTAVIEEFRVVITHGPLTAVPYYGPPSDYPVIPQVVSPPVIAGGPASIQAAFETRWPQAIIDEIRGGKRPLFILGFVKFSDDFTILSPKMYGFCFAYSPSLKRFASCKERAYTYAK